MVRNRTADGARRRALARASIAVVLVVGFVATGLGVWYVGDRDARAAADRLAARESDAVTSIAATLNRSVELLSAGRSFYQHAPQPPTEGEWEDFFGRLDLASHTIDVYGIGTLVKVATADVPGWLARRGRAGAFVGEGDDHCFLENTAWPTDEPLPIVAFMYDLCAAEEIAPSLRLASAGNRVTTLPRIPWNRGPGHETDFLLMLPMYHEGDVPGRADLRHASTVGWIVAMYRGSVLMRDALGAGGRQFAVKVYGDTASGRVPVGAWRPENRTAGPWSVHRVDSGSVAWDLHFQAPADRVGPTSVERTVLLTGALLTLLLAALAWALLRGRAVALAVADHAVRDVRESERRFRSLAASSPVGIIEYDIRGRCVYANDRLTEITGRTAAEMSGEGWTRLVHHEDLAGFLRATPIELDDVTAQARIIRPDGEVRWARLRRKLLIGDRGEVGGYVGTVEDVTAEVWSRDELAHRALHDSLTGLANRSLFAERLTDALTRRDRGGGSVAVLFLDLDQFKLVNDGLGHGAGDALLVEVADRLRAHAGVGETIARLSGDEFVVLLPQVDDAEEAMRAADRIAGLFVEPVRVDEAETFVTASVGVVVVDAPVEGADAVLRDADSAMYLAKERGRARAELFRDSLRDEARARLDLATALRGAIERDELELHYQPQIDLQTGAVVGAEALVRWERPGRGPVGPADFIELAEETGLIVDLGAWVFRRAVAQIAAWRRTSWGGPGVVSVNVSARELNRVGYVDEVRRTLLDFAVPASAICLEITESALDERSRAVEVLRDLAALGFQIAIDDFGTGWSSLSRLSELPVDVLKIDRSFINGLGQDAGARRITEAVIGLAHSLELTIVAEGVELPQQEDILVSIGCGQAQGFRWSRPRPAPAFRSWCEVWSTPAVASAV